MDYLFDVFLSHNSKDKEFVREIARLLRERGLRPWLDEEQLIPGERWQDKLARGVRDSATCAMFLGPDSLGDWQQEELDQVRSRAAKLKDYRVTPVLLPGLTDSFDTGVIPPFLENRTGIDYRSGIDDKRAFHLMVCSIEGNPPEPLQDGADVLLTIPGTIITPNTAQDENLPADLKPLQGLSVRYNKGLVNAGTIIITNNFWEDQISLGEEEIAWLKLLQKEGGEDLSKYIPLSGRVTVRPEIKRVYELKPGAKINFGKKRMRSVETRRFDDAVGEILKLKRAVVLGEPGAGKTMTLWKIAVDLIDKALLSEEVSIPIMIRLGNWTNENQHFSDFLLAQLGDFGDQLDQLLKENRAVLLLDGLNELPAGQRKEKTAEIRQFIDKWSNVKAIISCRQLDYTENELEVDRIEIFPLDPIRIRQFVCGYLGEEKGDKLFWRLAGEKAMGYHGWFLWEFKGKLAVPDEIFWNAATLPGEFNWWQWNDWLCERENPSSLMVMAGNPFMLMMLCSVYDEKLDTLPENRWALFNDFAETLFERERVPDEEQKPLVGAISLVAYQMQTRQTSQEQGDAVLPRSEALKTLDEDQLKIATRAGILSTGEEVRFTHQLRQEYFAARHMDEEIKAKKLKAESLWPAEKWWERNNWEETTVLLAGLYSDDCTPIIDWIADANPEVAAIWIKRSGANCPPETMAKIKKSWLLRLTDLKRDKDPRARAAVGRALGMTGLDDRKGVGTILDEQGRELPDIDWIEIPGGDFLYGKGNEIRTVGSFAISRYPVTRKQFQVFIDDPEGIRDKRWFEGLACGEKDKEPEEQAFPYDNHPRERVSWYQAVAFCRWLSWRMGEEYQMERVEEWKIRLPTELEWERAARGLDGRIYPYGNEFDSAGGNTFETGIGRTSAVGIFPDGASPDGVLDMSGNVRQWCLNPYESQEVDPAHIDLTTNETRHLRGGSWGNYPGSARAVYRLVDLPYIRYNDLGFRVVSVVPPPS
jgi:formylglycine-generating enzyme required for sulfatase activity